MYERELVLLREYIKELDSRPTFGIAKEVQRNAYYKYVASEIIDRLLDEEAELPIYIPDRMPYSAKEVVDNYIGELIELYSQASISEAHNVLSELVNAAETIESIMLGDDISDCIYTCQDVFTGRYFCSNVQKIQAALDRTNAILTEHGSVSLNTYYANLGIPGIKIGYNFSWDISTCQEIKLDFMGGESEDGRHHCVYVDFETYPKMNNEPWGL